MVDTFFYYIYNYKAWFFTLELGGVDNAKKNISTKQT
jgi:hypothetical protein